ncbi:hypothetical protein PATSB16_08240 [Pandoraea thiooxydans]|nr:hypothetical protein PATSB16_08240 [Pandoraea thiooxydans]
MRFWFSFPIPDLAERSWSGQLAPAGRVVAALADVGRVHTVDLLAHQ